MQLFELPTELLPARLRTERPMNDEEFIAFSRANRPFRMEQEPNGEITVMTPTGFGSGFRNMKLGHLLDEWAERDGRGYAVDSSTGFRLPDGSVRSADASWVERSRIDALTAEERERFAPFCPDFVIELRSKSDNLAASKEKMAMWMSSGAALGWLVDPFERNVTIYRAGQEQEELHDPTSMQGDGVVSGFELVMAGVWG